MTVESPVKLRSPQYIPGTSLQNSWTAEVAGDLF